MSVQNAMRFIVKVEQDDELTEKIRSKLPDLDLEGIAKMGAEVDLIFTVEELRTAFAKDWAARSAYYSVRTSE